MDVTLGDNIQEMMTLVFLDIRSFTSLSEQMTPEENFIFINEFLGVMEPVVRRFGGVIDKYLGDGIMSMFPGSSDKALAAGSAMLRELDLFNEQRAARQLKPVRIGIGMHSGAVMLGTVGGIERMETTVIGDAVNIASRIEGLNKQFGTSMLVSGATIDLLESPGTIHKRRIGDIPIRGKEKPITLYEIYDAEQDFIISLKDQTLDAFQNAVVFYEKGELGKAKTIFTQITTSNPYDRTAPVYAELCGG